MNLSVTSAQPSSSDANPKERPRDLFLFLEIFEREGGIQSYVQDIFRAYSALTNRSGADVFLLRDGGQCTNPFADSPLLQFHYFKGRFTWMGRFTFASALLRYLVQHRPRHVYCGHINLAPMVRQFCQPLGIPYTVSTHGKEVWQILPAAMRQSLQQAEHIWTVSRYSREQLCAANQIDPAKVQFLPCMVDGTVFTPGEKSPALLKAYGLEGSLVLMTVARLWSGDIYKGVDVTIRALPALVQTFPNLKYLVVGRGDDQPRLAQLAADLGLADRVVFAGFVPTSALVEHYRLADAYVMPSQEGFGIVYLEAMACGVPVLSGDADGSADPLQDGELGWCVPHRDPEAVAKACIEMLTHLAQKAVGAPYDRRCDGIWLRQQALAKFGQPAFAQQLQFLLEQD